jgi:hypothetical protein
LLDADVNRQILTKNRMLSLREKKYEIPTKSPSYTLVHSYMLYLGIIVWLQCAHLVTGRTGA